MISQKTTLGMLALAAALSFAQTASAQSKVNWETDVESALRKANQTQQLVLMKFTADWCVYCKKMEHETFTRPIVTATVNKNFVPVLVDADKHADLVKHMQIKRLPAMLIVSPQMVILKRINGYRTEDKLLPELNQVVAAHNPNAPPVNVVSQTQTVAKPTSAQPVTTASKGPSFGGLCLPSVNKTRTLISGRPEFALTYRGKTIYFESAEQKQEFQQAPQKYWPAVDGHCPVTLVSTGSKVEGKLEYAAMFRNKLWLSSSAEHMTEFVKQPARYADAITK